MFFIRSALQTDEVVGYGCTQRCSADRSEDRPDVLQFQDPDEQESEKDDRKDSDELFQDLGGCVKIQALESLNVSAEGTQKRNEDHGESQDIKQDPQIIYILQWCRCAERLSGQRSRRKQKDQSDNGRKTQNDRRSEFLYQKDRLVVVF